MHRKKSLKLKKVLSMTLVLCMLGAIMGLSAHANGQLIFHSGFEQGTTGVPSPDDPRELYDITGSDTTFADYNNWITNLDNYPSYNNFYFQYETKDNSRQRYAAISSDPTNMLFEDTFEELYAVGDPPRIVSNDKGKRNWTAIATATDLTVAVAQDPDDTSNQALMMKSRRTTGTAYPRVDKNIDASDSKRILVSYRVKTISANISANIDFALANVQSVSKTVIRCSNVANTGTVQTAIDPSAWTDVLLDIDLYNNTYDTYINKTLLSKREVLFSTPQTDFSNVRIRFNSNLPTTNNHYYLDDVQVKKTDVLFEDDFDMNYSIGSQLRLAQNDKGRVNWSFAELSDANATIESEPSSTSNQILRLVSNKTGVGSPKIGKVIDASSSQRITIDYKIKNLQKHTYLDLQLPTVSGSPARTLLNINGINAVADNSSVLINPNEWSAVSVSCDLYNNTYNVSINGTALITRARLFSAPQTDFRNVQIGFGSYLTEGSKYYIDDVEIYNTPNQILKYYAGHVINDGKLRIQTTISNTKNLREHYFKYRVYYNESFARLGEAMGGITSYWLTLAEFFDGSPWAWTSPEPCNDSRISMGIEKPIAGQPLKFHVDHQLTGADGKFTGGDVWERTSTVDIPIGQWVTMEIYLKFGVGTDPANGGGQFLMYLTPQNGVRQTVFEVNDSTYNPNATDNGFDNLYPMKLYGNMNLFKNTYGMNNDLRMYWDDFEIRTAQPVASVEAIPLTPPGVVADDVGNTIVGFSPDTMEYAVSTDGGTTFDSYTSNTLLSLGGSKQVKIRCKAQGQTGAGYPTILSFTPDSGDVNGDGVINISDVVSTAEVAVGNTAYLPEQIKRANVSDQSDTTVDISDVVLIVERVMGDTVPFPVDLP